jgi:hypothetical protein
MENAKALTKCVIPILIEKVRIVSTVSSEKSAAFNIPMNPNDLRYSPPGTSKI